MIQHFIAKSEENAKREEVEKAHKARLHEARKKVYREGTRVRLFELLLKPDWVFPISWKLEESPMSGYLTYEEEIAVTHQVLDECSDSTFTFSMKYQLCTCKQREVLCLCKMKPVEITCLKA